jgi:hypothetical protein
MPESRTRTTLAVALAVLLGFASFMVPRCALIAALFALAATVREALRAGGYGQDGSL